MLSGKVPETDRGRECRGDVREPLPLASSLSTPCFSTADAGHGSAKARFAGECQPCTSGRGGGCGSGPEIPFTKAGQPPRGFHRRNVRGTFWWRRRRSINLIEHFDFRFIISGMFRDMPEAHPPEKYGVAHRSVWEPIRLHLPKGINIVNVEKLMLQWFHFLSDNSLFVSYGAGFPVVPLTLSKTLVRGVTGGFRCSLRTRVAFLDRCVGPSASRSCRTYR